MNSFSISLLMLLGHSVDAYIRPLNRIELTSLRYNGLRLSLRVCTYRSRKENIFSNLRMDDEMARKGIKVDMTVHSEEELDEWRRAGGRLSESWYDLSPLSEVRIDMFRSFLKTSVVNLNHSFVPLYSLRKGDRCCWHHFLRSKSLR
jgi:hypothetical protein